MDCKSVFEDQFALKKQAKSKGEVYFVEKSKPESLFEDDTLTARGLALPKGETSRNEVRYIEESIDEAAGSMEGVSMLFNHDENNVVGHVTGVSVDSNGLFYEADVNPNAGLPNGVSLRNALERGDIGHVSIRARIDPERSFEDDDGVINAWITEFLELSFVTIPGFKNTDVDVTVMMLKESMGESMVDLKEKEKEKDKKDESGSQTKVEGKTEENIDVKSESKGKDVDNTEKKDDEDESKELSELKELVSSMKETVDDLSARMSNVEAKIEEDEENGESQNKGEGNGDGEDSGEDSNSQEAESKAKDVPSKEEAKEQAEKNDDFKENVDVKASEGNNTSGESKKVRSDDLKNVFKGVAGMMSKK